MVMRAFLLILAAPLSSVKIKTLIVAAAAAIAGLHATNLFWRRLESSRTAAAEWIWKTDEVREPAPVRFTAVRPFHLSQDLAGVRVKIFVDRSYRLFLDATLLGAGSQRPGAALDVYSLAGVLPKGDHRFAIEATSPTGIGGILFCLDAPGIRRGLIVSDGSWRVAGRPVWVWGRPPIYPWFFPALPRRLSASRAAVQQGFEPS
jgi:hypothetical protein